MLKNHFVLAALSCGSLANLEAAQPSLATRELMDPVRIEAGGKPIETKSGHAAPYLIDLDQDGRRDLVVGQFASDVPGIRGGTGRIYRNIGTDSEPRFDGFEILLAGGNPVKMESSCCIGVDPDFADLDGDGVLDMVNGRYCPGNVYWFKGAGAARFEERRVLFSQEKGETLQDLQAVKFLMATTNLSDLDGDGLVDLAIGDVKGRVFWSKNIGDKAHPRFALREPLRLQDGNEIKVPLKSDPLPVDWDRDGTLDLMVASETGDIFFFKGLTGRTFASGYSIFSGLLPAPSYREGKEQFEPSRRIPGYRFRLHATDWNCDGKLDLLVGTCENSGASEESVTGHVYLLRRK